MNTNRQGNIHTHADRQHNMQAYIHKHKYVHTGNINTDRHTYKPTHTGTHREIYKHTDIYTYIQTIGHTDTYIHTYIHT